MKFAFQIIFSILLLQFSGNTVSWKSFSAENSSAITLTQISCSHELYTLKESFPTQNVPNIYLLECEEDDEKTNKEQLTSLCLLVQPDSKQIHSIDRVEGYPVSTNARFRFSTKRYITFCSFRV